MLVRIREQESRAAAARAGVLGTKVGGTVVKPKQHETKAKGGAETALMKSGFLPFKITSRKSDALGASSGKSKAAEDSKAPEWPDGKPWLTPTGPLDPAEAVLPDGEDAPTLYTMRL